MGLRFARVYCMGQRITRGEDLVNGQHTHFSALAGVGVFLVVLIVGSAWRLAAYRLASSDRAQWRHLGAAMAFQY